MASVGTVVIEVDADVAKFVEGIKQTNQKISSLEKRAKEAQQTIANWAKATVGIIAVASAFDFAKERAKEFLDTASQFEQYENRMSAFYQGQTQVSSEIERAIDFSKKYNNNITDTMDAMIKMKVFGIDPTNEALEIFGNTAVGGGKSLDQFVEAMADAFQGENERLKEFGVKASVLGEKVAYAWSDSTGKSRSVVIKNNKDIIQSTLETIFNEKYVGQMQKRAESWQGFVTSMQNDYTLFKKAVMDEGLFDYIKLLASSFKDELTASFGSTKESAKAFSKYMQEMIKSSVESVAFLVDAWTGVKLVWNVLKVGFFGFVSAIGDGINWMGNKIGEFSTFMHNSYKTAVDGMWESWYSFMNFLGIDIKEVVKTWDSFTSVISNAWTSVITKMAKGFSDFINFAIKGVNNLIDSFIGLGSDVLEFLGFDKLEKISIPFLEFNTSVSSTREPLNVYVSDIKRAVHETEKLVDFKFSNEIFEDAKLNVKEYYNELKDNSAQKFIQNVFEKMETKAKAAAKETGELEKKTKDAKNALAELLKTSSGKLADEKKAIALKSKSNDLAKEAKRIAKEKQIALKRKSNDLAKEAKRIAKEKQIALKKEQKETERIAKAWQTVEQNQAQAFEEYTRNQTDAQKTLLSIMGDFETLAKMEDAETLAKIKPYISSISYAKAKKQLEELTNKEFHPTFADGIADAFNFDKNAKLESAIDEIGYRIGNNLRGAFDNVLANLKEGMSLSRAVTDGLNVQASSVYSDMKNSTNPTLQAVGYGVDVIEALGTDLIDLETNIHEDNKSILKANETLNNVMFPHLEYTKKMTAHLERMDRNFTSLAVGLGRDGFTSGRDWKDKTDGGGHTMGIVATGLVGVGLEALGLGGIVEGIGDFVYGTKTTLKKAGLEFGDQLLSSALDGVDLASYQLTNKKKSLLGVTYSNKDRMKYSEVDSEFQAAMDDIISTGYKSVTESMEMLGLAGVDALADSVHFDKVNLDFNGLSDEEIKAQIEGEIGDRLDQIAIVGAGGMLDEFQQVGEELYATMARVAVGFEQANYSLSRIGLDNVSFENIKNSNDGNKYLEYLNADTSGYITNILSLSEQLDIKFNDLNDSFASVNLSVPKTVEEYENLVESLDKNTIAGAEAYAVMMNNASATSQYFDALEKVNDKTKDLTKDISDAWLGNLSYFNDLQKFEYANNYVEFAKSNRDSVDVVDATKKLAEASMETSKSQKEYIPVFNDYIRELRNTKADATNKDLLDELKALKEEVIELKNAQYETARFAG